MLSKLTLKNIKSYKNESELHIAPITLIYGRNSAGKSTLWKLLRVLNLSEYKKNSYFPLSIINPLNQDFFSNIKSFSFDNRNPFSFGFEFLDTGSYSLIDEDFPNIGEPQKVKFNYSFTPITNKDIVTRDELKYLEEKMVKLEQQLDEEERFIKNSTNIDEKTSKEILKIKQRSIVTLREQRDMTNRLLDNLRSPSMVAERIKQIHSSDAAKMDRNLEVKINNENFMNFKIIESEILRSGGYKLSSTHEHMGGTERRIVNFVCKNFGKKFIFEPAIEAGGFVSNREATFADKMDIRTVDDPNIFSVIKTRKFDAVGPQGVLELKLTNKDLIRSAFDMFIPENVSKEKKFYKNHFNLLQSAKKLLKEISKKRFNLSILVTDFIKELKEEHKLKYRIELEKVPNIRKIFENFEKLINTDSLDEFSKILSEDFEYLVLLGFNLFPKEKIYGGLYHRFLDRALSHTFNFAMDDEQGAVNVNIIDDPGKFTKDNYFFNNWLRFTSIYEQIHRLMKNRFFKNLNYISNKEDNLMTETRIITSEALGLKNISDALKKINLQFDINVTKDGDKEVANFKNLSINPQQKNTISLRESGDGLEKLLSILIAINNQGSLSQTYNQLIQHSIKKKVLHENTFILEEPENKIHPRIQGNLIEYLSEITFNVEQMFIIETHSEHFILRLQKLIRENKLDPKMVAINYVYLDENGEGSRIDYMELDENGRFINKWRHGFFSERLKEL